MTNGTGVCTPVSAADSRSDRRRGYRPSSLYETERGHGHEFGDRDGVLSINGLKPSEAIPAMTDWLSKEGKGTQSGQLQAARLALRAATVLGERSNQLGGRRTLPDSRRATAADPARNERLQAIRDGESRWRIWRVAGDDDAATGKAGATRTNTMPQWPDPVGIICGSSIRKTRSNSSIPQGTLLDAGRSLYRR